GHDGAAVVEGDRVVKFGGQLPLSKNPLHNRKGGMRHSAALGVSQLNDSLCLVVSAEPRMVSPAFGGKFYEMGEPGEAGKLRSFLERFYAELEPPQRSHFLKNLFFKNYREKILSVLITLGLWYMVVYETRIIHKTFVLPVEYTAPSPE